MILQVDKEKQDCFHTVSEAVEAAKPGDVIRIAAGVYQERVEIHKSNLVLEGAGRENTVITEGYYALMKMEDGTNRGTFRSYTMLIDADEVTLRWLTVENSAGFGTKVGQAIALYAEGDKILISDCKLLGHQDTLFTGPLPMKEKQPGGFVGPTQFAERKIGRQLYDSCYICGEVDFIFGSAVAYFKDCELYALDRQKEINAFYTAPSTYEGQRYGYVFENCRFTGNCPKGTALLSRPWRSYAKAVFLHCEMDENVGAAGYHDWNKPEAHMTTFYAEYGCTGAGSDLSGRVDFAHVLTDEEAKDYRIDVVLKDWEFTV